jgi:hypothetical protein
LTEQRQEPMLIVFHTQHQSQPATENEQRFHTGKLREEAGRRGHAAGEGKLISSHRKVRAKGMTVL